MNVVEKRPISVLIITEYFFPTIGGVELHVYKISEYLVKLGLKVVIFTRNFGNKRRGIRYLHNGIKVYHHWNNIFIPPSSLPSFIDVFPYYRDVLIREQIDIVHSHLASSRYKLEMELYASIMGYRVVFTDHSLFSFCDLGPLFLNESVKYFSLFEDHIIAVSNRHKENIVLRSEVDPRRVSVIPNAIESKDFESNISPPPLDKIVIVYVSRLSERKGIDLLVQVVPMVCENHKNVEFVIGGGGPKLSALRGMVDKHYLHDRVKILGYIPTHEVNKLLRTGHIFLNTSQTESFCITLLEAASSGLITVSTNVGGIPEVLPHDMILLSEYDPKAVSDKIDEAISMLSKVDTTSYHERIKSMYSWENTSKKLLELYCEALRRPRLTLKEKFYKFLRFGNCYGVLLISLMTMGFFLWAFYEWILPRSEVEFPPNWSECHKRTLEGEEEPNPKKHKSN